MAPKLFLPKFFFLKKDDSKPTDPDKQARKEKDKDTSHLTGNPEERVRNLIHLTKTLAMPKALQEFVRYYLVSLSELDLPEDCTPSARKSLEETLRKANQSREAASRSLEKQRDRVHKVGHDTRKQIKCMEAKLAAVLRTHEAELAMLVALEQAYMCYKEPVYAAGIRLGASQLRVRLLRACSDVTAERPWLAVYVKGFMSDTSVSTTPAKTGQPGHKPAPALTTATPTNNPSSMGLCEGRKNESPKSQPETDEAYCPICTAGLHEHQGGRLTRPTDPNPATSSCHVCKNTFHVVCMIKWISKQESVENTCPMCRAVLDEDMILGVYQVEIDRLDASSRTMATAIASRCTRAK